MAAPDFHLPVTQVGNRYVATKSGLEAAINAATADLAGQISANATAIHARGSVVEISTRHRPGDSPSLFALSLAGGDPEGLEPLPDSYIATNADGYAARFRGPAVLASRGFFDLEPGRVYHVRFAVRRIGNSPDPSIDAVRMGVAWYSQSRGALVGGNKQSVIEDITDLTTGDGRTAVSANVATSAGDDIDVVAPAGARYARPFVQIYGIDHITDVEVLAWVDATDAVSFSPDVTGLQADISALQSIDAGNRLDELESEIGAPGELRFKTRTGAVAATVGGTVDTIRLNGYAAAGDGGGAVYKRVAQEPTHAGKVQSADGAWWEIADQSLNAFMFGAFGDGVDRTTQIQAAVDAAIALGRDLWFPPAESYYHVSDDITIESASNITFRFHPDAEFHTDGDHTGITLDPNPDIVKQRAFFALIDCDNVTFSGGTFDAGTSELDGFQHSGDGKAASCILALRSTNCVIEKTRCLNLTPAGVNGGKTDDSGRPYRYVSILGVKTKSLTIQRNWTDGAAYSAYETRIACTDSKILYNYGTNCGAHLTQCTPDYGGIGPDDPEEEYNRGVLIYGNTGEGEHTDITNHAEAADIIANTLIDVTTQRSISIRANTDGCTVALNRLICRTTKGDLAIQVTNADNVSVWGNTAVNYTQWIDDFGGVFMGHNNFVDVDDRHQNSIYYGRRAGLNNSDDEGVYLGFEAGKDASGGTATITGFRAGLSVASEGVSFYGHTAGMNAEGTALTGFGRSALRSNSGDNSTAIGFEAGWSNTGNNVFFGGVRAGRLNGGSSLSAVGFEAGMLNTGNNCVFGGFRAGKGNTGNNAYLFGTIENNPFGETVTFGTAPTAERQVNLGVRHIEMSAVPLTPETPAADTGRLYFKLDGGTLKLFAKFPDGSEVVVAEPPAE